jgi:hypothetical protein
MTILDAMQVGDVYIDFPYEDAKLRWERATGDVYRRFYGHPEDKVERSSDLFHQAISAGRQITREEYEAG